ncbi:hypothetical protein [Leucobacter chromiireducens]|uniref:Camelysin metallo-endopeptidase n=1 Tax=Leucobacter chromiireducens subsp. solipictus TaxID=398235 RepID=A0ABS1SJD3_9MICO|nr:hypothetical protein [Leucobacter chromiireducens]MBL3679398.1 hypothetical protein [Leucobacter chromiireducens subsp. solipictus]
MAAQKSTQKKKIAIAGGSLLLIAGVTVGGALVTANSTIFDNVFRTDISDTSADGELVVTGDPMTNTFTGEMDGEAVTGYYTATNTSTNATLTVTLASQVQPGGANGAQLADALDTRVAVDGGTLVGTGSLADMRLDGSDAFELAPGASAKVRVDVFVDDAAALHAADLDDSQVTADYLFSSIATSN